MVEHRIFVIASIFCLILLAGCTQQQNNQTNNSYSSSGYAASESNQNNLGTVVFAISDGATDMGSVTSVNVTIDSIQLHSATNGWITINPTMNTFDLISLKTSGNQALLAEGNISDGNYDQAMIEVSNVVVTDSSGTHQARIPSEIIRINSTVNVGNESDSFLGFDFIADQSLHATENGGYIFAPVIHLRTIDDANVDTSDNTNVQVNGGNVQTDVQVGMDQNGNVGVGLNIPQNAQVTIDGSNNIVVTLPGMVNSSISGGVNSNSSTMVNSSTTGVSIGSNISVDTGESTLLNSTTNSSGSVSANITAVAGIGN